MRPNKPAGMNRRGPRVCGFQALLRRVRFFFSDSTKLAAAAIINLDSAVSSIAASPSK
jgi:hypothetical protein